MRKRVLVVVGCATLWGCADILALDGFGQAQPASSGSGASGSTSSAGGGGGSLLSLGESCDDDAACESNICHDEVCCVAECDPCQQCAAASGSCKDRQAGIYLEGCANGVCDGFGSCATGDVEWLRLDGGPYFQNLHSVSPGIDDDVLATGVFSVSLAVKGVDTSTSAGGTYDAYAARFNPDGTAKWVQRLGGSGDDTSFGVTMAGERVAVVGTCAPGLTFKTGVACTDTPSASLFVAFLDYADGHPLDAAIFATPAADVALDVAAAEDGSLVIAGQASNDIGTDLDALLLRVDAAGAIGKSATFGDGASQHARQVALDAQGNVYVAGYFQGTMIIGDTLVSHGLQDAFVAKLNADLEPLWANGFGTTGDDYAAALALAPNGDVVVAGSTANGEVDFGGGLRTSKQIDVFAARFDAEGQHVFSDVWGDEANQSAHALAVDAAGNVLIGGWFQGKIVFGGAGLQATTGTGNISDAFVAKLGADHEHLWSQHIAGPDEERIYDLFTRSDGRAIFAGYGSQVVTVEDTPHEGSARGGELMLGSLLP